MAADDRYNLPTWLRGLRLSQLQCSRPGWLFRQGVGSSPALLACRVRLLHAMRLFSGRYRGSPMSSLKCDRPSHPDWGRLGVVKATGVDNRGQQSYIHSRLRYIYDGVIVIVIVNVYYNFVLNEEIVYASYASTTAIVKSRQVIHSPVVSTS